MCATNTRASLAQGFTLLELLICLALTATLLMFSTSITSKLYQKNQIQVIQDNIQGAIRFAKTHALTTGKNMLLTPLMNSNDWSKGMLLFVDNDKHHYTPTTQIIHEWHWQYPAIQVSWTGFQSNQYLLFSADANQNAANGHFLIKNKTHKMIKIVINRMARTKVSQLH